MALKIFHIFDNIRFLAIFCPIVVLLRRLTDVGEQSGDYISIIYRFAMRNYDAFLKKSNFWRENGPQVPTKKLAHWVDLFGQPLSRKLVFR